MTVSRFRSRARAARAVLLPVLVIAGSGVPVAVARQEIARPQVPAPFHVAPGTIHEDLVRELPHRPVIVGSTKPAMVALDAPLDIDTRSKSTARPFDGPASNS